MCTFTELTEATNVSLEWRH